MITESHRKCDWTQVVMVSVIRCPVFVSGCRGPTLAASTPGSTYHFLKGNQFAASLQMQSFSLSVASNCSPIARAANVSGAAHEGAMRRHPTIPFQIEVSTTPSRASTQLTFLTEGSLQPIH
jgi:hypothetical protein